MNRVRIGVLGCAGIAHRSMIPAILELKDLFELKAVSSRKETAEKARAFAKEFNCEAITGYENLLDRKDIDAVYIPLPTGLHEEWINKSLKAGKAVYAEKSIAMNYEEAKEMVGNAKENGMPLMEGYMFRYHPQHEKVRAVIDSGGIGNIRFFSASFGFPPLPADNFRYDNNIGGGALKDAAGYVVKASTFILKEALTVKGASVCYSDSGTSIYGSAFLRGKEGLGASVSFGFDQYYRCLYRIWGSKGILTATKAFTPKAKEDVTLLWEHDNRVESIVVAANNHFVGAMKEFYDTIKSKEKRDSHYKEILDQSLLLDEIERLSKI